MHGKLTCLICFLLVLGLAAASAAFGGIVIDIRVTGRNDDGEDHIAYAGQADDGAETRASTDLEMPWEDEVQASSYQVIGLRWLDIPISKGATITNAYVQFTADDEKLTGGPVNLIINGLLQPNPGELSGDFYTDMNPKTTAEVKWTNIPAWSSGQATAASTTPDISSVIMEIINQAGWAKGNALMLFIRDDETNPSAAARSALSTGDGEVPGAVLHIEVFSTIATQPDPPDGADNVVTPIVEWEPGDTARFHDVYFGTNPTPGRAEYMGRRDFDVYWHDPGITPGITYYWRIDEVEADGTTKHSGDVWSFTAAPLAAHKPDPADGARYVATDTILGWSPGATGMTHDVYFGTGRTEVARGVGGTFKGNQRMVTYSPGTLLNSTTYYWRIDEVKADGSTKHPGVIWSFRTMPNITMTDPNLIGWWKFDEDYGGIALDWSGYGNDGTLMDDPQAVEGIIDGALDLDGSDFVTIDGVVDDVPGNNITLSIWVKTTQSTEGNLFASNDGSGNHVLLFGISGGNAYVDDGSVTEFPPAVNDDQWHMLTYVSDGSTEYIYVDAVQAGTLSTSIDVTTETRWSIGQEWDDGTPSDLYIGAVDDARFYNAALTQAQIVELMRGDPLLAWDPEPTNRSIPDIEHATPLSWKAGDKAAQHDVYLGTDKDAVENADISDTSGIYQGRQVATSYSPPAALQWGGGPYYWRIDESNTDATVTKGRIWSFTVADYLTVDDIEDYNDFCDRIFYVWTDGWGHSGNPDCGVAPSTGNNTGSTVGHLDAPFAEQSIVHTGGQSMPFEYDNSAGLFYSETQRQWATAQDWTSQGIKALTLWYRGIPASVGSFGFDPATSVYTITAAGADIWNVADPDGFHDEFHFAYRRLSGAGSIQARVLSASNTDPWAKAGVMIRGTLDANSVHAMVVVTPGSGVAFQRRLTTAGASETDTQAGIAAPQWVKVERTLAGAFMASYSDDGSTWTTFPDPVNIGMMPDVYIGLALTSHNVNATCVAEFSDITTTGTVTGQWQSQDVGIQSNVAEQLYVAVEDTAGRSAVVNHEDPNAVLQDTWQAWNIDLARFTGVDLASIQKMYLGVGNRTSPRVGGSGTLYFDDMRLYRPRCMAQISRPALTLNSDCVIDVRDLQVLAGEWLVAAGDNGLQYEYYEGDWDLLPDFDAMLPTVAGGVSNFDITPRFQNDYFGFRFSGQISVPSAGDYTFYTTSDDGSRLTIGSTMVVDNDGLHAMVEQSGTINLTAGMHPITVIMFEKAGGEGLTVEYEGPGVPRQVIPDDVLYRMASVADLSRDGVVDFADYAQLTDAWLEEVLWP